MLVGHRAAVNVVDFDDKYIVSASGDRTIKVPCIPEYRSVLTSVHIFDKYGHPSISLFFQVRFFQQLSFYLHRKISSNSNKFYFLTHLDLWVKMVSNIMSFL